MVTGDDRAMHGPFGRFEVRTEPMGDGREIHYYEWPNEAAETDAPGARPEPAPAVSPEGPEDPAGE